MTKIKITFLIYLLFFCAKILAQFEVEYNEINGAITKEDKFKDEFGKYDGFEIPLYKGEAVNFILFSKTFTPKLIFVSPNGIIFKQSSNPEGNFASIITTIPEEGEWILFVVSDSSKFGDYTLQYGFASERSLRLPENSDFCTSLNFILAHSTAFFLLLEYPFDSQEPFIKLMNSKDAFIDDNDGSYTSIFLETDKLSEAVRTHNQLYENVLKCVDNKWDVKTGNWQNVDDYKIKNFIISERVNKQQRFINVQLIDLKGSKQKFMNDYIVQIIINRQQ